MTITKTRHADPFIAVPSTPTISLGPWPNDLLLPPGTYRASIALIECETLGPDEMDGPYEKQIWTFAVSLPCGLEVLYSEVGTSIGGGDDIIRWADTLLERSSWAGRMPNAAERADLTGRLCAVKLGLYGQAPPWLPGQEELATVSIPGGEVLVDPSERTAWWMNRIEAVFRPEDVAESTYGASNAYQRAWR